MKDILKLFYVTNWINNSFFTKMIDYYFTVNIKLYTLNMNSQVLYFTKSLKGNIL